MKNSNIAVALCIVIGGCATPQTLPVANYSPGNGQWGQAGVVVNDGQVYASGTYRSQLHVKVLKQLEKSAYFSKLTLNSIYIPQQIRVQITSRPQGSEEAAYGKLLVGAATLFLLPMNQNLDYTASFSVECRGKSLGEWKYEQPVEHTQFLLVEPDAAETNLVESVVSRFISDADKSGKLKDTCL